MVVVGNHGLKRPKQAEPPKPYPGSFDSLTADVCVPEGYDNAVDISYRLTDAKGNTFDMVERFYTREHSSEREKQFFRYLEEHGINVYKDINNLNDFIGCREKVLLKYQARGRQGRVFLNIVEREFVSAPASAAEPDDETD